MDKIQKKLIKAGRKDLAQEYFEKTAESFMGIKTNDVYTAKRDFSSKLKYFTTKIKKGWELAIESFDRADKSVTVRRLGRPEGDIHDIKISDLKKYTDFK